jgi:hypothetical protein
MCLEPGTPMRDSHLPLGWAVTPLKVDDPLENPCGQNGTPQLGQSGAWHVAAPPGQHQMRAALLPPPGQHQMQAALLPPPGQHQMQAVLLQCR